MAGKNKPTCVSGLISTDAWGALISVFSIFSWRWPYEVPDIYFSICVFEGLLYRTGGGAGVHLLWVVLDGHLGNIMLGIVGERRVLNNSGMWLFALEVEEIF